MNDSNENERRTSSDCLLASCLARRQTPRTTRGQASHKNPTNKYITRITRHPELSLQHDDLTPDSCYRRYGRLARRLCLDFSQVRVVGHASSLLDNCCLPVVTGAYSISVNFKGSDRIGACAWRPYGSLRTDQYMLGYRKRYFVQEGGHWL